MARVFIFFHIHNYYTEDSLNMTSNFFNYIDNEVKKRFKHKNRMIIINTLVL